MTIAIPKLPTNFSFGLTKRHKIVVATVILLLEMIFIRFGLGQFIQWRFRIAFYASTCFIISLWALHDEDFGGVEWITLPILPTLFSMGAALVYPLLPQHLDAFFFWNVSAESGFLLGMLTKVVFIVLFVIGYYATLLTSNIYNVAAVKSIQLLRVAHSIGFLMTVAASLFLFLVVSSIHMTHYLNALIVFGLSFLLSLQAIWSVKLERKITTETLQFSLAIAFFLGQVAWVLSFWPVGVSVFSLFLTAIFYELIGITQYHLGEKLNARIANEFIIVAVAVFLLTVLTTVWGA